MTSLSASKPTKEVFMIITCKHGSCENPASGRGYCRTHYMRWWRGQDMDRDTNREPRPAIIENDIAKIPLGIKAKNGYAIVDKEFAYLDKYKWHFSKRNAVTRDRGDKLHHEILGKPPEGMVIDHINRDTRDNRKANLRLVTQVENARNISPQKNNTSGYRGVWYRKDLRKWQADIKVNYQKLYLGIYKTREEAAIAYNKAAIEYFGEYAVLNDIH